MSQSACRFCGSLDYEVKTYELEGDYRTAVGCNHCGAMGPSYPSSKDWMAAALAWNVGKGSL